jgi:glycosyltransferase involved in cell wall biosynthesis
MRAAVRRKSRGDGARSGVKRSRARLSMQSTVCAILPHHKCEEWLDECLQSLVEQTRPLDAIAVIDDASGEPPLEIISRYPRATLLEAISSTNVGPYRLSQQVIYDTNYDAYLFQDADDWSSPDRLERLLSGAERTGAELIGSQELRVLCREGDAVPFTYPLDANAALRDVPTSFPLLHPTSMVSRSLFMRVGGFATGLRFGGDSEFLRRAGHAATLANVPHFCYFRRIRAGSLTTAASTGMASPERRELIARLHQRARDNTAKVKSGETPDLAPMSTAPPIELRYLSGPALSAPTRATNRRGNRR